MQGLEDLLRRLDPRRPESLTKYRDEIGKLGKDALPELTKVIRTGNVFERWAVASVMGRVGGRDVILPLRQALKDESVSVRIMAAQSLGELGDLSGIPVLTEALADESVLIGHPPMLAREYAAKVLRRYGETGPDPP